MFCTRGEMPVCSAICRDCVATYLGCITAKNGTSAKPIRTTLRMRQSRNVAQNIVHRSGHVEKRATVCAKNSEALYPKPRGNSGNRSTLGKRQNRWRTTGKTLSVVWSWQKNVDVADRTRQRLRADADHIACRDDRLPIGIPPLTNRATV